MKTLKTGLLLLLFALNHHAYAHFVLDAKTRVIHLIPAAQLQLPLELEANKSDAYLALRIPAPLIYASALATRDNPQAQVNAPYLEEQWLDGTLYYELTVAQTKEEQNAFADFVLRGYEISIDGEIQNTHALSVKIYDNYTRPHFNDLQGVQESFRNKETKNIYYVASSVIDILIPLEEVHKNSQVTIRSTLPKIALPADVTLLNIGYDHRHQPALSQQKAGQLEQAMVFNAQVSSSFLSYTYQGIIHILIGLDHVLFVLCLVMAAGFSRQIIWSVTGFTLGHSITFALGAFGVYPQANWFVPFIELVIAISIIIAATLIFWQQQQSANNNRRLFILTAIIGLLHGYGFSFVFSELVGDISKQIIALLGFNLGVEIGQMSIVVGVLLLLYLLAKFNRKAVTIVRYLSAVIAIVIACYWVIERSQILSAIIF